MSNTKNWQRKINQFLIGRYGPDELYKASFLVYITIFILNLFLNYFVLTIIELLLMGLIIYRLLSKNIPKRRKENERYLKIKQKLEKKVELQKKRWRDKNTHLYKKCPQCKTILRLPLKKGIHTVKCPNCSIRFKVKCRRNENVKTEFIKAQKK